jgi:hypothetical protein
MSCYCLANVTARARGARIALLYEDEIPRFGEVGITSTHLQFRRSPAL